MRWTVVIPAKALPEAKSRLQPATPDAAAHRALVRAIRADTVAAARSSAAVARVVLVVDRPSADTDAEAPGIVLVQSTPGLNAALTEAAGHAARCWPGDGVAALVGDLPALLAPALTAALTSAAAFDRAFVPDASGIGTTLLTAVPGVELRPSFGAESARRHALDARPLAADPGLRTDVDTSDDLDAAAALGLGPLTAAVVAAAVLATAATGDGRDR